MRMPRLSIAKLMIIVLAIAMNCALVRQIYGLKQIDTDEEYRDFIEASGVLIAANILIVNFYRLASRGADRRPFLIGFEVAGTAALIAFVAWNRMQPRQAQGVIIPAIQVASDFIAEYLAGPLLIGMVVGLPLLLIASVGGLFARLFARP